MLPPPSPPGLAAVPVLIPRPFKADSHSATASLLLAYRSEVSDGLSLKSDTRERSVARVELTPLSRLLTLAYTLTQGLGFPGCLGSRGEEMKSPTSHHCGSFKQAYGSSRAEDTIRYLALG